MIGELTEELSRSDSPQYAVAQGRDALTRGETAMAVRWLDRAYRLVPDDPTVALLFASVMHDVALDRCGAILDRLIGNYPDFRDARIARLACDLRSGQADRAATGLDSLLRLMAVPNDGTFHHLADAVVAAVGAPGWIGIRGDGSALISAPAPSVELRLDEGRPFECNRPRSHHGGPVRFILPKNRANARRLIATVHGVSLLGSGIALRRFRHASGYVALDAAGGLAGWAWLPADPDQAPTLRLLPNGAAKGSPIRLGAAQAMPPDEDLTARAWTFRIGPDRLPDSQTVRVVGPDGQDLSGSPVLLDQERSAARTAAGRLAVLHPVGGSVRSSAKAASRQPDPWRPLPVSLLPVRPKRKSYELGPIKRPPNLRVDVIVPLYQRADDFQACLQSLRGSLPHGTRIVLVDDGSPDPDLLALAEEAEREGAAIMLRHDSNRGFPAAANTGLRYSRRDRNVARDVVLLNSDTVVPPGWLDRLTRAAWSAADIGSVTPLTCDGTIVSYPRPGMPRPDLPQAEALAFDRLCQDADHSGLVDLPTAVGFCMYVRHDCLQQTGLLREDAFAQGYGEENDWCLRARHLGWRHVAVPSVFVVHRGGSSFGAAKTRLMARNDQVLNRLHPGYNTLIRDFVARDPLAPARKRIDFARWQAGRLPNGAVILVSHGKGGGVDRHLAERCADLRSRGLRPIILTPAVPPSDAANAARISDCQVSDDPEMAFPNIRFAMPERLADLVDWLRAQMPQWVEIHHLMGHPIELTDLPLKLGVPYDVVVHDYAHWCPRVTLYGRGGQYCGEPLDVAECEACVADLGARMPDATPVANFRTRSMRLLAAARRVAVSCDDVAHRLTRHFPGISPMVVAWENNVSFPDPAPLPRPNGARSRLAVVGGIGLEKGYEVLLGCARDAARRALPLEFVVVGHSMDDAHLLDTGRVFVTGSYKEDEALDLLNAQGPVAGFLPSVWPETWCYVLSTLWRAGLDVFAFGLGAQAERIKLRGRGWLLPLGLPMSRINDVFIEQLSNTGQAGYRS
jgi:GT2 family glycosyltransferase/glycosyltransferase involved in cell wall biosynthesis